MNRTAIAAIFSAALLVAAAPVGAQSAGDIDSECSTGVSASCIAHVESINVNRGDISYTTNLPKSETDKLSCSGGASVVNFRLARADEGNDNYQRMFDQLTRAAENGWPIRFSVDGGSFDCRPRAIRIDYGNEIRPGRP